MNSAQIGVKHSICGNLKRKIMIMFGEFFVQDSQVTSKQYVDRWTKREFVDFRILRKGRRQFYESFSELITQCMSQMSSVFLINLFSVSARGIKSENNCRTRSREKKRKD